MLSWKPNNLKGENRAIAIIKGGKYDKKILYLDIDTVKGEDVDADENNIISPEILEDILEDLNKKKKSQLNERKN